MCVCILYTRHIRSVCTCMDSELKLVDFIDCVSSTCYLLYGHQLLHGNVLRDMTKRGMEWKTSQNAEQKMELKGDLSHPSDISAYSGNTYGHEAPD